MSPWRARVRDVLPAIAFVCALMALAVVALWHPQRWAAASGPPVWFDEHMTMTRDTYTNGALPVMHRFTIFSGGQPIDHYYLCQLGDQTWPAVMNRADDPDCSQRPKK